MISSLMALNILNVQSIKYVKIIISNQNALSGNSGTQVPLQYYSVNRFHVRNQGRILRGEGGKTSPVPNGKSCPIFIVRTLFCFVVSICFCQNGKYLRGNLIITKIRVNRKFKTERIRPFKKHQFINTGVRKIFNVSERSAIKFFSQTGGQSHKIV